MLFCVVHRGPACNSLLQYERPESANRTRECVSLRTCNTAYYPQTQPLSLGANQTTVVKIKARKQYIVRYPTQYSDRECWTWMPCTATQYALQAPMEDENDGFLLKPMICMPYTYCMSKLEYTKVNGKATGDRDNVCVRYTTCQQGKEYQSVEKTDVSDRVCMPYTTCDPATEYLLLKGNETSNNVCARKTFCAAESHRSMYELFPPMDSIAWNEPGRDAVCAPISTCAAGWYVYIQANDTADVTCERCPKGMYKAPGMLSCELCPPGTFSDVLGATACKPCTNCLIENNASCPYADASLCRNSFDRLCQRDADAKCMKCPVESKGWAMDPQWGICVGCRDGFYNDMSIANEWERCVQCTANFYCPSSIEFQECEVLLTTNPLSLR